MKEKLKRIFYVVFLLVLIGAPQSVRAATGIYRAIHFQGKVVNSDGTNVADGNYDFEFKLYTTPTGGAPIWTETYNTANCGQLSVNDGIFSVDLGSCQPLPSDFNQDSLYLSINFNNDGEMTPRIRMTAVPYALNAEKVAGLTVTNTTGTLTIPDGVTIAFSGSNDLTLTTTGTTNATLPSGIITLVDTSSTQTLTNKTIGSTGLVFSGAAIDIDTAVSEGLVIQGRAESTIQTTAGNVIIQPAGTGTSAVVQIGTGGAGSDTPDFLALDVKSTSGDPPGGADGYMYYNAADGKFRCYQNGAWTDCIGSGSGSSPFQSSGGIITKSTSTDVLKLTIAEAGDYGLLIDTSVSPTTDMLQITNSGNGTTTDGVDGLSIVFEQAVGGTGETNSGVNISVTGSGDSTDVLSGLSISSSGVAGGTLYGIQIGSISGGAGTEYALEIGSGWDRGLSVASASVFSAPVTSESTLVIGTGGNTFIFDPSSGPVYTGTARPSKTITFSPEYPGAVLTAFYGAGTDTNTNGQMTSDIETTSSNNQRTYYQWIRSGSGLNYYTVAVRITLPQDFDGWETNNSLEIDFATNSISSSDNVLDVYVYRSNDLTTPVVSSTGNVSVTSGTYQTITFTPSSGLDDNIGADWDTAGQTAIIYLRMGSQSSNWVRISDIRINYKAKF